MPHGRASIWLGKVSDEEAAEIESYASRIADARNREKDVPEDVVLWLQGQPKHIRKKLSNLLTAGETVKKCVDEYVHSRKDELSLSSHNQLTYYCEILVDQFGARQVETVKRQDLIDVVDRMKYAIGTKRVVQKHWKRFFRHVVEIGLIDSNPAHDIVANHHQWTYFIAAKAGPRRIKIGFTSISPFTRLSNLATSSPVSLELLGCLEGNRESEMHAMFRQYHHHGEWFDVSEELLTFIRLHCHMPTRYAKKSNECEY
jgi:hypothetical protein